MGNFNERSAEAHGRVLLFAMRRERAGALRKINAITVIGPLSRSSGISTFLKMIPTSNFSDTQTRSEC